MPQPNLWVQHPKSLAPSQPSMHRQSLGTPHLPQRWAGTVGQCSLAMPWGTTAAGVGPCWPGAPGGTVPPWELVLTS